MDPRVETTVEELRARGFAALRGVVSDALVERMQAAGERIAQHPTVSWSESAEWYGSGAWRPTLFHDEGQAANYYDSLGVDEDLDRAFEEFLEIPQVRELLDHAVGEDRRMWFCQLRWAHPGADEYALHQDLYGELALCLYLSDHPDGHGSVTFWPGSHRWPRLLEAFPLQLPRWVSDELGRVDGAAGDVCVFFNKTWHRRTSAVGAPRLVMLISFLPPGPVEKPRRLPESARVRLGPELRKITSPDAARSFGAHPPADPPMSSAFELPENNPFTDEVRAAIRAYGWAWSRAAAGGETALGADVLRGYVEFVKQTGLSAGMPADVLGFVLEEFGRRAAEHGFGPRALHYLRMSVAQWNGDTEGALQDLAAWQSAPRDALAEPEASELEATVALHAARGDDAAVVEAGRPLLDGDLPPAPTAWSLFLLPFVRLSREDDAAKAHARGYPGVCGQPIFMREIGRHLEYLALAARPDPALQVLCDHLATFGVQHNTGGLWYFWSGAWVLFARMQRAGARMLDRAIPHLGPGPFEVAELAAYFRDRLVGLAECLDHRNGNDYRTRQLAQVEARIGWPTLPDPEAAERPGSRHPGSPRV